MGKESTCKQETQAGGGSSPRSERASGGGPGNPFQYSCLENLMDRGAWWATTYRVAKSQTQLSDLACLLLQVYTQTVLPFKTGRASASFSTECDLHMVESSKERGLKKVCSSFLSSHKNVSGVLKRTRSESLKRV